MKEQHKHSDCPLISEVAEHYEEARQPMVQGVLEEIALCPDEDMGEESAEVFAGLKNVEDFHLKGR